MKRRGLVFLAIPSAISLAALAIASCFPTYDFSSTPGEGAGSDASEDTTLPGNPDGASDDGPTEGSPVGDDAPEDTRIDAPTTFSPTPVAILASNGIATQTGNAQQQHLVFATNSQRWWFFYLDADPNLLKTKWSIDFTTWNDGASLTLPMGHGGEGRNFSVAYKDIAGRDVVHVATSLHDPPKRIVYETRATIAGDAITWEAPSYVHDLDVTDNVDGGLQAAGSQGSDSCDPDGVDVTIGADGHVYVATSWVSVPGCCYCDSNFGTSTNTDNGGAFDGGYQAPLYHYTVNGTTSAREIISLASGNLVAGWESADNNPPSNVTWATRSAGVFSDEYQNQPEFEVFPEDANAAFSEIQEKNDWSFCKVDDTHIHALHRKYKLTDAGASTGESRRFEHYLFSGGSWTFVSSLADDVGEPGTGVVLVTNGSHLLAATIAHDGVGSIRYATWNGSAWTAWSSLVGPDGGANTRAYLSGTDCADSDHPAILWTEGANPPYQVVAVPVAGLIP
jgi:hypothetical protein